MKTISALALLLGAAACDSKTPPTPPRTTKESPDAHIQVQHILISFKGALPKPTVTRTKDEARELAQTIFQLARSGKDFDALVKEYSDDSPSGIYRMADDGVDLKPGEKKRRGPGGMVEAFGNVSFALKVGEIGMAEYDPAASPYGWHIIKRLK